MIQSLRLRNFKGFERFDITFRATSWLVGPNNAGKSTVVAALRTAAQMVSIAKRQRPSYFPTDEGVQVAAHTFPAGRFGLVEENLRHEFRDVETRLELRFSSGARLYAVWPADSAEAEAYFYARTRDGVQVRQAAVAREVLPEIGVVPILGPVEREEARLTDEYVRSNRSTRLASRHARNQLRMLRDALPSVDGYENSLAEFLDWARPYTADFRVGELVERQTTDGYVLDVFCREAGSRSERELFWAGDGIQVWTQLLVHLFRLRDRDVVILDEPDLFLHADLQRRLVRLLESTSAQTIAASHSAEVLVEAPPSSVIWVSKDRRRAVRAPSEKLSSDLTAALGSQFNLRLARALRAKAVVFVEGDDMRMLRNVAATLGAERFATEDGIVTIPLRGFSNWQNVEPFAWMLDELLDRAVGTLVVLDRDYKTDVQIEAVEDRLSRIGVRAHVWRRKELESYFLNPSAIARKSGASETDIRALLLASASACKEAVFARVLAERLPLEVAADNHLANVAEVAQREFDQRWADESERVFMCNAKDLLSEVNGWLQQGGYRTVSARALSASLTEAEVPDEMQRVIHDGEELAT